MTNPLRTSAWEVMWIPGSTSKKFPNNMGIMLLHRHRAIIWGAFGVVWLNSRGWGCSKDYALCESADLRSFCTRAYPCLSKLDIAIKLRGGCVWLCVMLLHSHRAIIWHAFGVAWLNSRGWGYSKDYALCYSEYGFAEFLYRDLPLSFKAQCLP